MDNDGWYREYQAMKHEVINASVEIRQLESKLSDKSMHYEILQDRCEDRMIKLHEIGTIVNNITSSQMTEAEKKIKKIFQDWSDIQKRRDNLGKPFSEQFT